MTIIFTFSCGLDGSENVDDGNKKRRDRDGNDSGVGRPMFGPNANASDEKASPLAGSYWEYSGALGEDDLPKKNDAKVSITFTGKLAANMFGRLGPSAKYQSCSDDEETR